MAMQHSGDEFLDLFVASFVGSLAASRYDDCCARGEHERIVTPGDFEEALYLGMKARTYYREKIEEGRKHAGPSEEVAP